MGTYDVQQICVQGHQVTDRYLQFPQHRRKHCTRCGAVTIHQCPECDTAIKGHYDVPNVISGTRARVPTHCEECGTPFPWAETPVDDRNQSEWPWYLVHPEVEGQARTRFESAHFADSAEAAVKVVVARVKALFIAAGKPEKDGKPLMQEAFSVNNPIIRLADLQTQTGRNIQEGHMHLFAGATQAIRNPKAHGQDEISPERSMHFIMLASMLMHSLDDAGAV